MKEIMISIQPKWCELIASGKKTVEIRKTRPKLDTPFRCYIYCTKPSRKHQTICGCIVLNDDELYRHPTQGIKHGDSIELMCRDDYTKDNFLNGKVIGEFVCDSIVSVGYNKNGYGLDNFVINEVVVKSCIQEKDLYKYLKGEIPYLWHISDFVIYDTPKSLDTFRSPCLKIKPCEACRCSVNDDLPFAEISVGCDRMIRRPPRSWCYVEKLR